MKVKIGIIGGSGLNNSTFFESPITIANVTSDQPSIQTTNDRGTNDEASTANETTSDKPRTITMEISCGSPSSPIFMGKIRGVDCALLLRHGKNHSIMPSNINFRANIEALKHVGCTHILASAACGSLQEEYKPGDFVIIDQFVDRTYRRQDSFYDGKSDKYKGIMHLSMGKPFCNRTRNILSKCAQAMYSHVHTKGTMVVVEGPRFSSKAESLMHRRMGGDLVGMTAVPEVVLAKELGICYATLAVVTDYDCWKETEEDVNVEMVMSQFKKNAEIAIEVMKMAIGEIGKEDWTETIANMEMLKINSIMQ